MIKYVPMYFRSIQYYNQISTSISDLVGLSSAVVYPIAKKAKANEPNTEFLRFLSSDMGLLWHAIGPC